MATYDPTLPPPPGGHHATLPPPPGGHAAHIPVAQPGRPIIEKSRASSFVLLGVGAMVAFAAMLPWVSVTAPFVGQISVAGTEGDGVITLVLGVLAALCGGIGLMGERTRRLPCGVVGGALLFVTTAVAGYDIVNISSKIGDVQSESEDMVHASVGMGLWLTAAAAVIGLVGLVVALIREAEARPAGHSDERGSAF